MKGVPTLPCVVQLPQRPAPPRMLTLLGGSQTRSLESGGVASNVANVGETNPGQERELTCEIMVHTFSHPLFTNWGTPGSCCNGRTVTTATKVPLSSGPHLEGERSMFIPHFSPG